MIYADRIDAGRRLAHELAHLRDADVVVLGLPRGGVPVAAEVASSLGAPLDVGVVRKLGVPFQPELAMGAIAEDGARVINDQVVTTARVDDGDIAQVEESERAELDRRAREYRGGRPPVSVAGRTVVVVDDGIATGATARAACRAARARHAERVVLAVPVAPRDAKARVGADADEFVCPELPYDFAAVGQFYRDFAQTTDHEVVECLRQGSTRQVTIPAGEAELPGELNIPQGARGVVVFVHGSGSSRLSPRNRFVADALNGAGLGTLLFDLLTEAEEHDRANVFDIGMLADRLATATRWLEGDLPIGYFGASTGAAAALWAAADPDLPVAAVVSRGGRPDLAGERLGSVTAPTLLIVGGNDPQVLELNHTALLSLGDGHDLKVVPGATHLFEEPGALSQVAELARDWFTTHLGG
ncbi:phosphoribosyltransferase family protein [Streptomyces litchfieldiae]|uniref:Phosphoribosyltransferase family protein n=1 Tax=Streptomyces litchfieldiae TaxID=3075543 RepID=A0ABU2MJB2_9ACTN|nr:phosphoribosyltransferase family protein [Streptomyces sp. DSM 44938]MDT0341566.1 phosphoribosyltransferase family protein [Streptomyces sp. DSM 44938]